MISVHHQCMGTGRVCASSCAEQQAEDNLWVKNEQLYIAHMLDIAFYMCMPQFIRTMLSSSPLWLKPWGLPFSSTTELICETHFRNWSIKVLVDCVCTRYMYIDNKPFTIILCTINYSATGEVVNTTMKTTIIMQGKPSLVVTGVLQNFTIMLL